MSSGADGDSNRAGACPQCLRRAWLLGELSPLLDYHRGRRGRLAELLALSDEDLIDALAGSRRRQLRDRHREALDASPPARACSSPLCRHDPRFPAALDHAAAPPLLNVAGGIERLATLMRAPAVALLGGAEASDYGVAMAASLARGLAASGVTVMTGLADAIGRAAQQGALEAGSGAVSVLGDGLEAPRRGERMALYGRVVSSGCAVSELPGECRGRGWGAAAAERIVVGLAQATVVIEARDGVESLAAAGMARSLGRVLGAVPGPVTSPLSAGPHALLADGAILIRGAGDILELLYDAAGTGPARASSAAGPPLEPGLARVLGAVGAGADTVDRLAAAVAAGPGEILVALGELEVRGLLRRSAEGRYLRRDPETPQIRSEPTR
ncbi:MAG: DNA-processing protein DprA [Solirubrobacteraceae bacterium]